MDRIIQLLEQLSFSELQRISIVVNDLVHARNPETIAYNTKMAAVWAARAQDAAIAEAHNKKVTECLRKVIKPGMRLKMKGCKDRAGFREFIKFDENDNLVCWQILPRITWPTNVVVEQKTNQVTIHMPNKVSWVRINNVQVPISKLIT